MVSFEAQKLLTVYFFLLLLVPLLSYVENPGLIQGDEESLTMSSPSVMFGSYILVSDVYAVK